MHGSIRNNLESLLQGKIPDDVSQHLSGCRDCADEVSVMREQSDLFRVLRADEEAEPSAGFYARVLQRIEERTKDSIWAFFAYSAFGKRLAFTSLSIAVLLGSYVVAQEELDGHLLAETTVAAQVHYDVPVEGNASQQRDAVLQNFAAPHDGGAR